MGSITSGVGTYLYRNTEDILLSGIQIDGINGINGFDRTAADYSSDAAARASDVSFIESAAVPFALRADNSIGLHATRIGLMYDEVFLFTTGLTIVIKSMERRPSRASYAYARGGTTPQT